MVRHNKLNCSTLRWSTAACVECVEQDDLFFGSDRHSMSLMSNPWRPLLSGNSRSARSVSVPGYPRNRITRRRSFFLSSLLNVTITQYSELGICFAFVPGAVSRISRSDLPKYFRLPKGNDGNPANFSWCWLCSHESIARKRSRPRPSDWNL